MINTDDQHPHLRARIWILKLNNSTLFDMHGRYTPDARQIKRGQSPGTGAGARRPAEVT